MTYRILSIDGGGIRGVIAATLLHKIESEILTGEKTLTESFNMFAGTSTGSVIAAALASNKKAESISNLYQLRGKNVFPYRARWSPQRAGIIFKSGISAPKYSDKGLKSVLRKELERKNFGDIKESGKRLIITSYDTIDREKFIFDSDRNSLSQTLLSEAAICSSSAPTFFPAQRFVLKEGVDKELSLIDGGVVANNPTMLAIGMAINSGEKLDEIKVLSVGTGDPTRSIALENAREWGLLEWVEPIVDVLFDGASDANHCIASQLLGNSNYLRLQFKLDSIEFDSVGRLSDDIDDASQENISSLIEAANKFYEKKRTYIEGFFNP